MKIRIQLGIALLLPLLKVTKAVPQTETATIAANPIKDELTEDKLNASNELVEQEEIPTVTMPGITNRRKPRRRKYNRKHDLRKKSGTKEKSNNKN